MTGKSIKPGRRFARPPTDQTSFTEPPHAPSLGAERGAEAGVAKATPVTALSPRAQSKTALITDLLGRAGGASLGELVAATGWQPHTTRAALTGLRKKGHTIAKDSVAGVIRYVIAPPTPGVNPTTSCMRNASS
ncbi:MAG: DUF3489 domain-containing protein [Novosphingobium sp.]|nr:DUF3489 domain-containing protein [Novosphingobium sp.]